MGRTNSLHEYTTVRPSVMKVCIPFDGTGTHSGKYVTHVHALAVLELRYHREN